MIKKSCLYALAFFVIYAVGVLLFPTRKKAPEGQSIFQGNIIRAQAFVFSSSADHIFVGSSLSHMLRAENFGSNYFNLAMPGDSFGTGMELIRLSGKKPKYIFVESNFFVRAYKRTLVETFNDPVLGTLRRWLPVFRERYQPVVVLSTKLNRTLTRLEQSIWRFQTKISQTRAQAAPAIGDIITQPLLATINPLSVMPAPGAPGADRRAAHIDVNLTAGAGERAPNSGAVSIVSNSHSQSATAGSEGSSRVKDSGEQAQSPLFEALVTANKREFELHPWVKKQIEKNVAFLKEHIRELEPHGTTFVFFEMPVHHLIRDAEGVRYQRELLLREFPQEKYKWVFPRNQDVFKTMDGLHLIAPFIDKFENFLKAEIEGEPSLIASEAQTADKRE